MIKKFKVDLDKLMKYRGKHCPCNIMKNDKTICPCDLFCKKGKCICGVFNEVLWSF
ncbi:MAG: hypothetical protein ACQESN_08720 [Thermotogota bacterium]